MTLDASPLPRRPRFFRLATALTAVALLAGVAGAYQVGVRAKRPPSFDRGGAFLATSDVPRPGVDGRPYPYGDASATTAPSSSSTSAAPSTSATPASPTGAPTVAAPSTTAAPGGDGAPADVVAAPVRPAVGTYTYAVDGQESATGFGTRRYPERATVAVHAASDVRDDELVHDLRLSGQHEERTVVRYGPAGLALSFEGGSITFGPGTQTSQGSYDPLLVQVPYPLAVGATARGSSRAWSGGSVSRVEGWTATVVGEEVLHVLGQDRRTFVVDIQRTTPDGAAEQVDRSRRYWFDPALGTWVRWTERFAGARRMVVDFTYSTEYTATLVGFRPA